MSPFFSFAYALGIGFSMLFLHIFCRTLSRIRCVLFDDDTCRSLRSKVVSMNLRGEGKLRRVNERDGKRGNGHNKNGCGCIDHEEA